MICWDPPLLIRGDFLCCSPRVARSAPLFLFCLFQDESGDSLLVSGDLTLFSCSPPSAGSDEASGGDHRVQNLEAAETESTDMIPTSWNFQELPAFYQEALLSDHVCFSFSGPSFHAAVSEDVLMTLKDAGEGSEGHDQRFLLFLRTYRCSVFQSNSFRKLK